MIAPVVSALERRWADKAGAAADRVRAILWTLRGARLGAKNGVGPHCSVARPWRLSTGDRVRLERGVFIKIVAEDASVEIGSFSFLGAGCELDVAGRLRVGSHVLVAPGCFITDHSHRHQAGARIDTQGIEVRPVAIGDDAWIGANCVVLAGVTIGAGAIVGAGAVVTRDVAPGSIVAGVPAREIGRR